MQTEKDILQCNDLELVLDKLYFKKESPDTTIVQLQGKLVRAENEAAHIVVALHAKDSAGRYVHLQQYEFEYTVDAVCKEIDICALVLSELKENEQYEFEIKVLKEQADQQWEVASHYITQYRN